MRNQKIYIVGSGISGIGAAYYLHKRRCRAVLIERETVIGGRAGCHTIRGTVFETGGKNFNTGGRLTRELLDEFNMLELDTLNPTFPFITNGKLYAIGKYKNLPGTIYSLIRSSGVTGCMQFFRFIHYIGRNRDRLGYSSHRFREIERQYDTYPLVHYFELPLAYGALRMFCIVFSGTEPEETYFSNLAVSIAGQRGRTVSIEGGTQRLFNRMLNGHEIINNMIVRKVIVKNNQVTGLVVEKEQKHHFLPANRIILAVPGYRLKEMMDLPDDIAAAVGRIRYSPIVLVVAKYGKDIFGEKINSVFFDRNYYLGHVSVNRSYEKNIVRYTFSGKKGRKVMDVCDERLIEIAEKELATVLPDAVGFRIDYKVYRYEKGVCAYCDHFSKTRRRMLDYFSNIRGLAVTGDFLNGQNMEGCLLSSKQAVDHLLGTGISPAE